MAVELTEKRMRRAGAASKCSACGWNYNKIAVLSVGEGDHRQVIRFCPICLDTLERIIRMRSKRKDASSDMRGYCESDE